MGAAIQSDHNQLRVWALLGQKVGDNTQVLALAEALGWPFETKRFHYRRSELLSNLLLGPNLLGIIRSDSSELGPPWPDLVISAGRRNEPVARWIARRSGHRCRIVHLGRPWAPLDRFDLIVTTPQYQLPSLDNILHNQLPLHRIDAAELRRQGERWRPRLSHLAGPFTTLMVGGSSGPLVFGPDSARRLGREISDFVMRRGGSLLVSTSARTGPEASAALRKAISVPVWFHEWSRQGSENPYLAWLALADQLVVTSDSMSMLTEACATGKDVYIFDMAAQGVGVDRSGHRGRRALAWMARNASRVAPTRLRRDPDAIRRRLLASGRVGLLGGAPPAIGGDRTTTDETERTARRVRALLQARPMPQREVRNMLQVPPRPRR
jgi:mitochondrial fission protein ELM1